MKLYSTIPKKGIKTAKFDKSNQNKNKVRFIYNFYYNNTFIIRI